MGEPEELVEGVGEINLNPATAGFWKPWDEVEEKEPSEMKNPRLVRGVISDMSEIWCSCQTTRDMVIKNREIERASKRQRHQQQAVGLVLPALSRDLWRLVCSFVADNPLWLYSTWACVCKRAAGAAARQWAPHMCFDLQVHGEMQVPRGAWTEWRQLKELQIVHASTASRHLLLNHLAAAGTRVHTISLQNGGATPERPLVCSRPESRPCTRADEDMLCDDDLACVAKIKGLRALVIGRPSRKCHAVSHRGLQHLTCLPKLQQLDLEFCNIGDLGLSQLAQLHGLQKLSLTSCNISNEALGQLSRLCHLQQLGLNMCYQIGDSGLTQLACVRSLEHLDLSHTLVTDLSALSSLCRLRYLNLNHCDGLTEAGLSHLVSLPALQHLSLARVHAVTDSLLPKLTGLRGLRRLDLSYCHRLTSQGMSCLVALPALRHLDLASCTGLDDEALRHLSSSCSLEQLDLTRCYRIGNTGLNHLTAAASMASLQTLKLAYCAITNVGLASLVKLRTLRELDIQECPAITPTVVSDLQALLEELPRLRIHSEWLAVCKHSQPT
eukprot:g27392.t1